MIVSQKDSVSNYQILRPVNWSQNATGWRNSNIHLSIRMLIQSKESPC